MKGLHAEHRPCCLVTGANGFIGSELMTYLPARGVLVRGAVRQISGGKGDYSQVSGLGADTDWRDALQGCDVVVHAAGRAHVLNDPIDDQLALFRQVNVAGTLALARQALAMGIRRFVFISSIGVNGIRNVRAFTEEDIPAPVAPYAQSKLEAELGLQALVEGQPMELVIIRPPLVYAAHAPGNFARLLRLVAMGVPLPLAYLRNQRSMIALENLVSLIHLCVTHSKAAGELFLAADGEDVSTPELLRVLAQGMGRSPRLWPMPTGLLALGARLSGKQALYTQLCDSLRIDAVKARHVLGWQPPRRALEALLESGRRYAAHH